MPAGVLTAGGGELAAIAAKWLLYASSFAGAGGAMFIAIFAAAIPPLRRNVIERWVRTMCVAALLIGVGRIGVLAGASDGNPLAMFDPALLSRVLHKGEGMALLLRSIGLIATLASLACSARSSRRLSVVGVGLVAISYAQVGHVLDSTIVLATQLLLALHIFCICYWLGALMPLRLCCQECETRKVGPLLSDFGRLAVYLVGALLFAGASLLAVLVEGAADTLNSRYVTLLAAKIVLVVALLALATLNKLELVPRLNRGETRAVVMLQRSINAEIAIVLVILLATAALTTVAALTPE